MGGEVEVHVLNVLTIFIKGLAAIDNHASLEVRSN